nr:hypothetical protein [Tanacetum cinerariifolium]
MSRDGSIFVYNPDVLLEQFAGLVIQRGLPFNHFNDEQTTRVAAKQAIIDGFVNLNTNVNLPKDVWSAPHGVPGSYICVTAHWIEPDTWQMMKRVIAFEDFLVSYTGSALARTLRKTFVNLNLENKIMSITLDNASNNTFAIGKLKLKYEPPMDGRFYHSRCVAHIVNLYVKYGNPTTESSSGASSLRASGDNQMSRLLNWLQEHTKKKARNDPSLSFKYERYVNLDFVTLLDNSEFAAFDLLGFWKAKKSMFPVLSHMAMDIISVQATLVASESALSTSGRVLSIRRTRLTPASLEMCVTLVIRGNVRRPMKLKESASWVWGTSTWSVGRDVWKGSGEVRVYGEWPGDDIQIDMFGPSTLTLAFFLDLSLIFGQESTWGGRARVIGTVPVCLGVQERAGGEGRVLAGRFIDGYCGVS